MWEFENVFVTLSLSKGCFSISALNCGTSRLLFTNDCSV